MQAKALVSCLIVLAVLFAVNLRYVYPASTGDLPGLQSGHIVDPRFSGTTFSVVGTARSVRFTSRGILFMQLHDPVEDIYLDTSVFPSLGCLPVRPLPNDEVRVTGNLGSYGGRPQIRPLSAAHVEVLRSGDVPPAIPLEQAVARAGDNLRVGPLRVASVTKFTSQAQLKHLRLRFEPAGRPPPHGKAVQGIMFEGDWSHCDLKLLRSSMPVVVDARIDEFRGEPSLTVRRVAGAE